MAESTEIAVVEQPQQLITIEPKKYVELVFEPFAKQFEEAKNGVREVAYDITTTAGMNTAIKWRATFRDIRVASEKARKLRKAPILEIGKLLDSRQNDIEATFLPLETLFDEEIKAEEARKEAEKQAKLAVEKARVDAIHTKIDAIRRTPANFALKPAAELKAEADCLSETVISIDEFAEFTGEAMQARGKAVEQLRELQESAEEMEAAQARLAEERAQFERDRAAAEERDRQAAVARAEQEARDSAARDAAEKEQRAAREAAQRKLDDERREFEQQQAAQQAAADKIAAATSEIQGIQQQVIIAQAGRAGVRKGGTIECLRDTLTETEAWEIDPERFGILAAAAESAKTTAVAEIRRLLAEAEARVAAEAAAKLEADHAEALEENARIDAETAAAAESARIRAEQDAEIAEQKRRERVQFALNGPGDAAIVELLATHYGVSEFDVVGWIERFDSKPYDDKIRQQKAA